MKSSTSLFVLASMLSMLFAPLAPAQEDVVITEFMASNTKITGTFDYHDEDNDYSDWIEIYNNSLNSVNLENWSLTDNAANLTKWQFPATNIAPSQFLIVFASGKDRRTPGRWDRCRRALGHRRRRWLRAAMNDQAGGIFLRGLLCA